MTGRGRRAAPTAQRENPEQAAARSASASQTNTRYCNPLPIARCLLLRPYASCIYYTAWTATGMCAQGASSWMAYDHMQYRKYRGTMTPKAKYGDR